MESFRLEIISPVIHLIGVSIVSFCFARCASFKDNNPLQKWTTLTWFRTALRLFYVSSWLLLFIGAVFSIGVVVPASDTTCMIGNMLCLIFYISSKILAYALQIEKIRVAWGAIGIPRMKSKVYRVCLLSLLPLFVIFVALLVNGKSFLTEAKNCQIIVVPALGLLLLGYDLALGSFLTGMFVWPLLSQRSSNAPLRALAWRHLLASVIMLAAGTINLALVGAMRSAEPGWICLAGCGLEIVISVIAVSWLALFNPNIQPNSQALSSAITTIPTSYLKDQRTFKYPDNDFNSSVAKLPLTPPSVLFPTVTRKPVPRADDTSSVAPRKTARNSYFAFFSSLLNMYCSPRETEPDIERASTAWTGRRRAATLPTNPYLRDHYTKVDHVTLALPLSVRRNSLEVHHPLDLETGRQSSIPSIGSPESTNFSQRPSLSRSQKISTEGRTPVVLKPSFPLANGKAITDSYTKDDLKDMKYMNQLPL